MPLRDRPIGIFDSGVGGLTVVKEIMRLLPKEDIVYFGDTARVPYGTKSKETVTRFSVENTLFLLKHDVKLIVVACHTASSLALETLKRNFKVPVIGVIDPGVHKAASITRNGRVGIIGTRSTVASGAYGRALERHWKRIRWHAKTCPLFVPLAEEGWLNTPIARQIAAAYLGELKKNRIDTLILGCTHYPLLKPIIQAAVGKHVELVDSAKETAKIVKLILAQTGMLKAGRAKGRTRFFVSDEPVGFRRIGERFLGRRIAFIRKVRSDV